MTTEAGEFTKVQNAFRQKCVRHHGSPDSITQKVHLIRTFFFVLFGYSIDLQLIMQDEVMLVGSIIVAVLLVTVFFFILTFFLKEQVFPEVVFIPRGLITILLFYKIPECLKLEHFNESFIFCDPAFHLIMMTGISFIIQTGRDRGRSYEIN